MNRNKGHKSESKPPKRLTQAQSLDQEHLESISAEYLKENRQELQSLRKKLYQQISFSSAIEEKFHA